jgi:hypothetical protein
MNNTESTNQDHKTIAKSCKLYICATSIGAYVQSSKRIWCICHSEKNSQLDTNQGKRLKQSVTGCNLVPVSNDHIETNSTPIHAHPNTAQRKQQNRVTVSECTQPTHMHTRSRDVPWRMRGTKPAPTQTATATFFLWFIF